MKIIASCGCLVSSSRIHLGKKVFTCSKCLQKCCDRHYYFQPDESNRAITLSNFRNGICVNCKNIRKDANL